MAPLEACDPNARIASPASIKKGTKRSIDHVDDLKPQQKPVDFSQLDCAQVRRKLNAIVSSGEMKIGQLAKELGVSQKSYRSLMTRAGASEGSFTDAYPAAIEFLQKRADQGVPEPKAKRSKPTKADTAKWDVSDVTLPGEKKSRGVSVYDTCADIRTKISRHLREPGVSRASLAKTLSDMLLNDEKVTTRQITTFQNNKGSAGGNSSPVFYAAYVFFEKLRVKKGTSKSKKREEMEGVHGANGVRLDVPLDRVGIFCKGDKRPYLDKYAAIQYSY